MRGAKISAIEYSLGAIVESNQSLLADNPSWDLAPIEAATGIVARRLSRPDQTASDLAVEAAERLFQRASLNRNQIDALIVCTQSPDYLIPSTACLLQDRLQLSTATMAFDINMACSGYLYGLSVARGLIKSEQARTVLLINADTYSKFIDKANRTCRPLFGDAAAVTLIEAVEGDDLIGPFDFGTDGRGYDKLILKGSGVKDGFPRPPQLNLEMDGAAVLMFTMSMVPRTIEALYKKTGLTPADIDLFVFHQASKKVLDNLSRILGIPDERMVRSFAEYGNTVSATIPIALKDALSQGRIRAGQRLLLAGFGVGLSWGACCVRWGEPVRA
jgi:3-oxoacyl-[acyl-carrier-protein] synthase-3